MKAACWQLEGDGQTYSARAWCSTSNGVDVFNDAEYFNPLMQNIDNATSYVALDAGLAAAKGATAFGQNGGV